MKVIFTREAEEDFESIGDWIAQDNPTRADSFVDELREFCLKLPNAPQASPLVPRFEEFGIRRRIYRNYLIFYRIIGDVIEISHIIHGARDYDSILSEEFE